MNIDDVEAVKRVICASPVSEGRKELLANACDHSRALLPFERKDHVK